MKYSFQQKKRSITYKLFSKGIDTTSHILLALYENTQMAKEGFLRGCPQYPGFGLARPHTKQSSGVGARAVFGKDGYPQPKKEAIRLNLSRLQKEGLIKKDPKQKFYSLTDKGKELVSYIENRFLILQEPWDKKFRVVIFDVPEKKRHWRVFLKRELELMQFQQLQKSVYIGKFPLPVSLIKEIEADNMGKSVYIFIVENIDRQDEILKMLAE